MINNFRIRSFCRLAVWSGILILTGCKSRHEKIEISETRPAAEISVPADSLSRPDPGAGTPAADTAAEKETDSPADTPNAAVRMNTFSAGKISIRYPSILTVTDETKAAAVNSLIKDNALSVIEAYEADGEKDIMDISCKVLSADSNRIIITYSGYIHMDGAAYPVNLFYSNTIDVKTVSNIGLGRYADPYTMAGYLMSNDCQFLDKSAQEAEQLRSWLHTEGTVQSYTAIFNRADFPYDSEFPSSFSYEYGGAICFSVPVSHALGDYAIVIYTPDTK